MNLFLCDHRQHLHPVLDLELVLLPVRDIRAIFLARLMRSQRKIIEAMTTPANAERNITIAKDA